MQINRKRIRCNIAKGFGKHLNQTRILSHNSSRIEYMSHLKLELNSVKMRKVLASVLLFYSLSMSIGGELPHLYHKIIIY